MPDNGTSIGSLLSGAVSALGQGASDMIRKVGQLEIYDKRERARSDAFVMDRVEKDPALLSIPEIARSYDRVLGAKNAHLIKLEEYQNQQQLRQVFNQLISSKITPVPGQTLQTAERTATVGPQGVTSQTPSTSGTITTPSTLPKMEPGEEVDIGPKGATYKRKSTSSATGETAIDKELNAYRAATLSGDTEAANLHHQRAQMLGMSPEQRVEQTRAAMEPFVEGAEERRNAERRQEIQDRAEAAPDAPIKGAATHYENDDGSDLDPSTSFREVGKGLAAGTIRAKTTLGQQLGNFLKKTFIGSTPRKPKAATPEKSSAPQDLEGKLTEKYMKSGTVQ